MREKEDKGANQIKCPEFLEITTSKSQNMTLKEHFMAFKLFDAVKPGTTS